MVRWDDDEDEIVEAELVEEAVEPRPDTAVATVIRGEPVAIPTPAWGALVAEDLVLLDEEPTAVEPPRPTRPSWLGWTALGAALATAGVTAAAVAVASAHDAETGTLLAWTAIALSGAAFVLGVLAAVLGRGRAFGILAAVVAVGANPWILLQVLSAFAP